MTQRRSRRPSRIVYSSREMTACCAIRCCSIDLRQGALVIAIIEMLLSAIVLFLLLLGSAHTQDMAAMLETDVEESERFLVKTEEDTALVGKQQQQQHHVTNHIHLHKAQQITLMTLVVFYTSIAMVTIHVISCILLVYGIIMQVRICLLPWLSVVLIGLACSLTALLACLLLRRNSISLLLIMALFVQIRLFSWLVVYNYFRQVFSPTDTAKCVIKITEIEPRPKTISKGEEGEDEIVPQPEKPAEV